MARSPIAVRKISPEELSVLERALLSAPAKQADIPRMDQLDQLQVVGRCACGCASIDFRHLKPGEIADVVADAIGETSAGEQVGILVFSAGGDFVGLEIVGYSNTPSPLPLASTVRGWGG